MQLNPAPYKPPLHQTKSVAFRNFGNYQKGGTEYILASPSHTPSRSHLNDYDESPTNKFQHNSNCTFVMS